MDNLGADQVVLLPEQARAARAFLRWRLGELARRTDLSVSTLRAFERERRIPKDAFLRVLRGAFEEAGIEFRENGAIRRRPIGDQPSHGDHPADR